MKLTDLYGVTLSILRKELKANPDRVYKNKAGEKVELRAVVTELSKISAWLCPDLRTHSISMITSCQECKHYKKHKGEGNWNTKGYYMCDKHNMKTSPDFFCKDGEA